MSTILLEIFLQHYINVLIKDNTVLVSVYMFFRRSIWIKKDGCYLCQHWVLL